jgi:hypothetical protein
MYNEEQQEANLAHMIHKGFPVGRMLYNKTSVDKIGFIPNALVSTKEDGPFWYGDLSESELSELHEVSKELNRVLAIRSMTGTKEFSISPID